MLKLNNFALRWPSVGLRVSTGCSHYFLICPLDSDRSDRSSYRAVTCRPGCCFRSLHHRSFIKLKRVPRKHWRQAGQGDPTQHCAGAAQPNPASASSGSTATVVAEIILHIVEVVLRTMDTIPCMGSCEENHILLCQHLLLLEDAFERYAKNEWQKQKEAGNKGPEKNEKK